MLKVEAVKDSYPQMILESSTLIKLFNKYHQVPNFKEGNNLLVPLTRFENDGDFFSIADFNNVNLHSPHPFCQTPFERVVNDHLTFKLNLNSLTQ